MAEKMRKLTFWENYYRPMKRIKDRSERAAYALKVLEYAFDDVEPELNDLEAMSFDSIAPLIYEDMHGNKGGRPSGTSAKTPSKTGSKTSCKTGSKTGSETNGESQNKTPLYEKKGIEDEESSSLKKNSRSSVASGDAAAADAAPPAAKPMCPLCGVKVWRNTQTGRYHCDNCLDSFDAEAVAWQGEEAR